MFSKFAKLLLVSTSLAPILGAVAVNKIAGDKSWVSWMPWLVTAVLLVLICWLLLVLAAKTAQKHRFKIAEFERNDKEAVAFLLAYLLPFISKDNLGFDGQWLTGTYILLMIFAVIVHAGTLHFNPVMGLLGYHFYAVKNEEDIPYLLISKSELYRPGTQIQAVRIASNIYLHVKES